MLLIGCSMFSGVLVGNGVVVWLFPIAMRRRIRFSSAVWDVRNFWLIRHIAGSIEVAHFNILVLIGVGVIGLNVLSEVNVAERAAVECVM